MGIMMLSTIISCIIIDAIVAGLYVLIYYLFGVIPIIYIATAYFCTLVAVTVEIFESESIF